MEGFFLAPLWPKVILLAGRVDRQKNVGRTTGLRELDLLLIYQLFSILPVTSVTFNWRIRAPDRFFKTLKALIEEGYDLKSKVPKFFSVTRFAIYVVNVDKRFREMYPALVVWSVVIWS